MYFSFLLANAERVASANEKAKKPTTF